MPAPQIYQTQTDSIIERQKIFEQTKAQIAQTAWQKMVDYNPTGAGTWGGTLEWGCPDGNSFIYSSGNGELQLDGNNYSTLDASKKRIFHRWLPQFTKQFVIRYNLELNI